MKGGGSVTEFEKIYQECFKDVFLFARRLSGDEHIAEEITSDTFFKAMRSLDSFRGDCDIRVWLCQIAKNCYFSYQKKRGRIEHIDNNEFENTPEIGETLEERVAKQDEAMRIQKVLHDMQEPYKEVFMWRVFGEMSFKRIGELFGKSENWACVTYHRAKSMVKDRLEGSRHEK